MLSRRVSVLVVAVVATTVVLVIDAAVADQRTNITVTTREPVPAQNQERAISGTCYGREITVKFRLEPVIAESYATVKVGEFPEQKYNPTTPFVRDLLFGSKASYQMFLFCSRDKDETFLLQVWGTSLQSSGPVYVQTKVLFERSGRLKIYPGLKEENYDVVRSHMLESQP